MNRIVPFVVLAACIQLSIAGDVAKSCKERESNSDYDDESQCPSSYSLFTYAQSDTCASELILISNNSVHIIDKSTNKSQILCHERTPTTWLSPTGQRVSNSRSRTPEGADMCQYSILELSNSSSNGVYTCNTSGNQFLYVGVYNHQGMPYLLADIAVTYNITDTQGNYTIGLNWTTTGRPLVNLSWFRSGVQLNRDVYQIVDVLRDKVNATYDHLVTIPRSDLDQVSETYFCKLDNYNVNPTITILIVPPIPSNLSYNSSDHSIAWVVDPYEGLSFIESYHIEYIGGWCAEVLSTVDIVMENFEIKTITSESVLLELDAGTNYTVRMKSHNFINSSRWSEYLDISTANKVPTDTPTRLSVTPFNYTSILVEWEEVDCSKRNGYITSYILRYGVMGNWTSVDVGGVLEYEARNLNPSTRYTFQVAAVNDAGVGMFTNYTHCSTSALPLLPKPPMTIAIISGVVSGLLCVILVVLIPVVIIVAYVRRKRSKQSRLRAEWNEYVSTDGLELEVVESEETEPVIEDFPEDVTACLSEYLIFYVAVSGSPPIALSWFHNNENVISDRSIEVRGDGTLSIPCVEDKHVGVYRMVASNCYGSCSCELKMTVSREQEGESCDDFPKLASEMNDCEPIAVSSFEEYVASHHSKNNEAFHVQFMSLNSPDEKVASVGALQENRDLNRFKNIYPYDTNCISLEPISGYDDVQNSYINASYIRGHNQHEKFIASQAPLPHTVVDFWHLVWQERTSIIVMICNIVESHRVRCQHYWPVSGSQLYGPFSVHLEKEEKLADYVIRKLTIFLTTSAEPPFCVTHYQFTSWPDHHPPDHVGPLLSLHKRVMTQYDCAKGPILVHCSSGVGRTGVFIALDNILEQTKEGVIDVMGVINKMRKQRMRMVQTIAQYIFVYDSALESIVCGETQVAVCNIRMALKKLQVVDQDVGKNGFEKQYQVLKRITPNECEVGSQLAGTCSNLNRSIDFLAFEQRRVVQTSYPGATLVDGYRQKKGFIISQGPSEDLCAEFWKMILKHKCGTIVMLSERLEFNQEVCYCYWPQDCILTYGDLSIELYNETVTNDVVTRTFNIVHIKTREQTHVTQFQILNWMPDGQCSNYRTIISLLKCVVEVQMKTGNNPITVHCSDPVGRSAMFCAVMSVIERCKMEGVIDVFQVIKAMRMQKHGAIQSVDQYSFIFDIVVAYLDSMETYANFR